MVSGTQWTEKEDNIIRANYPTMGPKLTAKVLEAKGFHRDWTCVKARASKLGVKVVRRQKPPTTWSRREEDILREYYPIGGAELVYQQLKRAGFSRSKQSISVRASSYGVKSKRKMVGEVVVLNIILDSVLDAEVITHLKDQYNRSRYVRELVARDMRKSYKKSF